MKNEIIRELLLIKDMPEQVSYFEIYINKDKYDEVCKEFKKETEAISKIKNKNLLISSTFLHYIGWVEFYKSDVENFKIINKSKWNLNQNQTN